MAAPTPIVLVPGLLCTARLFGEQLPELWRLGPVTVANHTSDDDVCAIARRILGDAPPRFALAGLSLGGYIAFEILRQAPDRVARLGLLDTSARPDTPEQTERRHAQIALARAGRLADVIEQQLPLFVHRDRLDDEALRAVVTLMAQETGPETFIREQLAIMSRPDSRADLAAVRCPTLVLVGDSDALTPPYLAAEMADAIDGASLVTVAGCGHLTTLERPEPVTRALVQWLQA
jgi:pimeloyl-ACP methyl ester carboxylesterase